MSFSTRSTVATDSCGNIRDRSVFDIGIGLLRRNILSESLLLDLPISSPMRIPYSL